MTLFDAGVEEGEGDGKEPQPVAQAVDPAYEWEIFTTVNYATINQDTIGAQAGVHSTSWSPGVGIERHLNPNLALGFAVNLVQGHQEYTGGLGNLDMDGVSFSTYASYVKGSFWADVLYNFGHMNLDSERNPGFGLPMASGETTAITNSVQLNTGWNFRFLQDRSLVVGVFTGIDYMHASVDGYSENGGGIGALSYSKRNFESLIARVGATVSKSFNTSFATITPQLRVAFERQNLDSNNGTSVSLINVPFTATATSQAPGQEYMIAGAGVNFDFTDRFNMLLTYQGQFFRQYQSAHYGGVQFGYRF